MQDDSVFADFDLAADGCLFLVRISFDGYGCCYPKPVGEIAVINKLDSELLISSIHEGTLDALKSQSIIRRYLSENKDYLWSDALESHQLL